MDLDTKNKYLWLYVSVYKFNSVLIWFSAVVLQSWAAHSSQSTLSSYFLHVLINLSDPFKFDYWTLIHFTNQDNFQEPLSSVSILWDQYCEGLFV